MNPERGYNNPIGLYRNPDNKMEMGCIEPAQADAVVQQGYVLVKEGREAALTAGQPRGQAAAAAAKPEAPQTDAPKKEGE